jgi:hypothetical protein
MPALKNVQIVKKTYDNLTMALAIQKLIQS